MLISALVVLSVAFVVDRSANWYQHWQIPHGFQQSHTVAVTVGKHNFNIPIGFIRAEHQRDALINRGQKVSELGLTLTWPFLTMPGDHNPKTRLSKPASLIEVELESNQNHETLRAQLDPFYRRLARGGEIRGPAGLNILKLSARTSPNMDQIVYDPSRQNGFIARCRKNDARSKAICHRTLALGGGLELRYQFDRKLLAEWRTLDLSITAMIQEFEQR